ncbi:hypothetical protein BDU57DRAFT_155505 [Ampelomyces quisqualis]|uniref:Uncharacterized protein n=1 Tax=Ampelomyces quisqualis TaxID=50730 RepID=A0A6A5QZ08_AMPQU|nr:hypothetical protein BDU57DRAFT_155505 [Ampelomyces quisqualis]
MYATPAFFPPTYNINNNTSHHINSMYINHDCQRHHVYRLRLPFVLRVAQKRWKDSRRRLRNLASTCRADQDVTARRARLVSGAKQQYIVLLIPLAVQAKQYEVLWVAGLTSRRHVCVKRRVGVWVYDLIMGRNDQGRGTLRVRNVVVRVFGQFVQRE